MTVGFQWVAAASPARSNGYAAERTALSGAAAGFPDQGDPAERQPAGRKVAAKVSNQGLLSSH